MEPSTSPKVRPGSHPPARNRKRAGFLPGPRASESYLDPRIPEAPAHLVDAAAFANAGEAERRDAVGQVIHADVRAQIVPDVIGCANVVVDHLGVILLLG